MRKRKNPKAGSHGSDASNGKPSEAHKDWKQSSAKDISRCMGLTIIISVVGIFWYRSSVAANAQQPSLATSSQIVDAPRALKQWTPKTQNASPEETCTSNPNITALDCFLDEVLSVAKAQLHDQGVASRTLIWDSDIAKLMEFWANTRTESVLFRKESEDTTAPIVALSSDDVFLDLNAGRGRLILHSLVATDVTCVIGVTDTKEFVDLIQAGVDRLTNIDIDSSSLSPVSFVEQLRFRRNADKPNDRSCPLQVVQAEAVDFVRAASSGDDEASKALANATVIFWDNLHSSQMLNAHLGVEIGRVLRPGTMLVTTVPLQGAHPGLYILPANVEFALDLARGSSKERDRISSGFLPEHRQQIISDSWDRGLVLLNAYLVAPKVDSASSVIAFMAHDLAPLREHFSVWTQETISQGIEDQLSGSFVNALPMAKRCGRLFKKHANGTEEGLLEWRLARYTGSSKSPVECVFSILQGITGAGTEDSNLGMEGTYGEITEVGVAKVLTHVSPVQEDRFVDIGSGMGKVVFQAWATTPMEHVFGIELSARRHFFAQKGSQYLLQTLTWLGFPEQVEGMKRRKANFFEGDALQLEEHWGNATIVFMCSLCFPDFVMTGLSHALPRVLVPGSVILSMKPFIKCHPGLLHVGALDLPMSWKTYKEMHLYLVGPRLEPLQPPAPGSFVPPHPLLAEGVVDWVKSGLLDSAELPRSLVPSGERGKRTLRFLGTDEVNLTRWALARRLGNELSTWDCLLKEIYPGRREKVDPELQKAFGGEIMNVEILPKGLQSLVDFLGSDGNTNSLRGDVFADLGSGWGKAVLQMVLTTGVDRAVGIEVSKARHALALQAVEALRQKGSNGTEGSGRSLAIEELDPFLLPKEGHSRWEFFNGDFRRGRLDDDLVRVLQDASVVLANSVFFTAPTLETFSFKLAGKGLLKPGCLLLSMRQIPGCHPGLLKLPNLQVHTETSYLASTVMWAYVVAPTPPPIPPTVLLTPGIGTNDHQLPDNEELDFNSAEKLIASSSAVKTSEMLPRWWTLIHGNSEAKRPQSMLPEAKENARMPDRGVHEYILAARGLKPPLNCFASDIYVAEKEWRDQVAQAEKKDPKTFKIPSGLVPRPLERHVLPMLIAEKHVRSLLVVSANLGRAAVILAAAWGLVEHRGNASQHRIFGICPRDSECSIGREAWHRAKQWTLFFSEKADFPGKFVQEQGDDEALTFSPFSGFSERVRMADAMYLEVIPPVDQLRELFETGLPTGGTVLTIFLLNVPEDMPRTDRLQLLGQQELKQALDVDDKRNVANAILYHYQLRPL